MKKCEGCGRETMDSAKFCEFCGRKFPESEQTNEKEYPQEESLPKYEPAPLPGSASYQPQSVNTGTPPPNNGMVWLILSSVIAFLGCFCYGLGILLTPSIIFGAISVSKYNKGRIR